MLILRVRLDRDVLRRLSSQRPDGPHMRAASIARSLRATILGRFKQKRSGRYDLMRALRRVHAD